MAEHAFSRRTMLRGLVGGAAASVGLPTLEIMLNSHGTAYADGRSLPLRFMTWFFGNGIWPNDWIPQGQGPNWPASPLTKPLFDRGVNEYCSILTGFQNRCTKQITHHEGLTCFNGYSFIQCSEPGFCSHPGGPTIDQLIAGKIGSATTFDSVHIGVCRTKSLADSGSTMFALSHKGTQQPQFPEHEPIEIYKKLFGSFVEPTDPSRELRLSVLDSVRADAATLRKRLGAVDSSRLDAHLEALYSIEKKITTAPKQCIKPMEDSFDDPINPPGANPAPLVATNEAMADLLAFAFACDLTRVASFLFSYGAGEHYFTDVPNQYDSHHNMSHNTTSVSNGAFQAGVVYQVDRFAYLLERLMKTPDASGGNLLDHSIILMGSDSSWNHDIFDQPIIVAGGGGGKLVQPGIHYRSSSGENPTDVLLTLLQCFDPAETQVGGGAPMSTTPFTPIKAAG